MPIFQSANFEYAGESSYHDLRYIRLNNTPNQVALHQLLAAVENAPAALVTASGMAAISTTLLTVLADGGHLLAQDCLYGGTHDLLTRELPRLGMASTFITHLRVGGKIVNARGVHQLYQSRISGWFLLAMVLAAVVTVLVAVAYSPAGPIVARYFEATWHSFTYWLTG